MKILIASLLKRKVAPDSTSSRPRIIFEISNGMRKKGHEVTFIGTGDSFIPGVDVIPITPKSFADMKGYENAFYSETSFLVQLAKKIESMASAYDIVHNHTYPEFINLMISERISTPIVTTLHAQVTPDYDDVLSLFPDANLISISNAQKKLFKKSKVANVVYNGIDTEVFSLQKEKSDYLLWLGRLSKAKDEAGNFLDPKGVRWAIRLAQEINSKLLLSGNVEDPEFFNKEVKPHLNERVQWVGNVSAEYSLSRQEVSNLMKKARAFLMTINWYEPFGLVMAEAMSCGTPVIGFDRGSVSEIVVSGKTGFVVPYEEGIEGLKKAFFKISEINPEDCRNHTMENFSVERMILNYEKVYNEIINKSS